MEGKPQQPERHGEDQQARNQGNARDHKHDAMHHILPGRSTGTWIHRKEGLDDTDQEPTAVVLVTE